MRIRKRELYPEDDRYVDKVIEDMVKLPILHVGKLDATVGSQLDLLLCTCLLISWSKEPFGPSVSQSFPLPLIGVQSSLLEEEEVLRVSASVKCPINQNQSFGPLPPLLPPSLPISPSIESPLGLLQLIIIWQQGLFGLFIFSSWSVGGVSTSIYCTHSGQWKKLFLLLCFLLEAPNTNTKTLVKERLLVKWGDKLRWIGLWSETFPIYSIEKLNLKDWLNTSS